MSRLLKLWYYSPDKRLETPSGVNAGDYFGRWLLEKMGYTVLLSNTPDIISVGSILGKTLKNLDTYVWGSGFHNETDSFTGNIDRVKAVRGKLSYDKLNTNNKIVLGDPGLLASKFVTLKTTKKYKYGIIPHYVDYESFKKLFRDKSVPIINIATSNISGLLNQINECEFIFSSSLHGIIFSHSLGIPAIHLEGKKLFSKNNFKFKDYYSALSIDYVKESSSSIDFDKYINSNYDLYRPSKKELELIQDNLLASFPFNKKIAICAVAKCENNYINDWVKYHIDQGIDDIYLYDNNDLTYEDVQLRIDKEYRDKVHIFKIPGAKDFQVKTYNNFYHQYKDKYDWIGFFDIDEFVTVEKWKNIKVFLDDPIFDHHNVVKLNWHLYGDDDLVERDMSVPVYDGITHRLKGHAYESHCKQFVRGKIEYNVEICSNHWCTMDGRLPRQVMPDGKLTDAKISGARNCEEAYVRHYMTKTLSEFINQKIARRTDASFSDRVIDLDYYWKINKKTPEKLKYIEENL